MFQLRPYQQDVINKARQLFASKTKAVLLVLPTGAGKTALTANMIGSAAKKGMSSIFIVHRRELVLQSAKAFDKQGIDFGIISSGFIPEPDKKVQIASIQTLSRRLSTLKYKPNLIIFDECFIGDTFIDGTKIKDLVIGDYVTSYNEDTGVISKNKITHIFKNKAPDEIYELNIDERKIYCTGNHPFFVDGKWIEASKLEEGMFLYELCMRKITEKRCEKILYKLLQIGNVKKEYTYKFGKNEKKQSNEKRIYKKKDERYSFEDWSQTHKARRKWHWIDCPSEKIIRRTWEWMGCRICTEDIYKTWKRFSKSLQDRYFKFRKKNSDRSRWKFSFFTKKNRAGHKEGVFLKKTRLDSIKVYKRGSNDKYDQLCPDGFVYNIEVDNDNTYFADGFLVHNCHHLAAKNWTHIYQHFIDSYKIGLTATPCRLDGRGLNGYFDELVLGPSMSYLIENKYLSDYKLFAPTSINLSGIHTKMGDYVKSELANLIDKPKFTGDAINEYKRHALGKRAVVFCVNVEHSKHVANEFTFAGIPAEHIDGSDDISFRTGALKRFEAGQTKVLCNVDLFGEGFDLPSIECAILLRPTKSLSLYLQQVGRALRPTENKTHAIIIDHVRNVEAHGLPDDDREWSLDGIKKRNNKVEMPIKICPVCYAAMKAAQSQCPECKYIFIKKSKQFDIHNARSSDQLNEIDKNSFRKKKIDLERVKAISKDDLVQLAIKRGYKYPHAWAQKVFQARQRKKLNK